MIAWSLVRIHADGTREQILSGCSEASTLASAMNGSHADHDGVYEVHADGCVVLRLRAGRMISEPPQ